MKLSEAIRLGAMLKPKGVCFLFSHGRTCAMGAALDACGELPAFECGGTSEDPEFKVALRLWPILGLNVAPPVKTWVLHMGLLTAITHLNDSHCWTREEIADWVESIERAEEAKQAQPASILAEVTR